VRIALVSRELYPYIGGGIAPIVAAAARELADVAEVTVVTSASGRAAHDRMRAEGDPRLLPEYVRLAWVEEPHENWGGWYSYLHLYSARAHAVLKEFYGEHGPDIIEFCDYLGEGLVTVQDRRTGGRWLDETQVCVRLHTTSELCAVLDGHLPDDIGTIAIHDAERYVLKHADRILWSGGDVLGTYQRYYGAENLAPAVKLPDAFLVEREPDPDPSGAPGLGEPLRLLYLGRAERRKGVQNLLRAFTALERPDIRLTLLGGDTLTGPLGHSLRAQLKLMAHGDHRIDFLDAVPRHEVSAAISRAHVVVVPSLWECWPNVAREAMLHNRPVLATPVGGLTELVQPGRSGWLTRDSTPAAIEDAIDRLADNPAEVAELIAESRPRTLLTELADPGALRAGYAELARKRRRPPSRAGPLPVVSIVVPYFRLDELVEETLASIQAQTYPEIEVMLVNDGSLREEDARVFDLADRMSAQIVTQPNTGLGPARNFGIAASRGRYVLPLDADDMLAPEFVARCVEALEANADLAYVTSYSLFIEPDGTPIRDELGGYMPYGNWSRLIEHVNAAGPCSALLRRRLFEHGYRYSADLTSYEDWLLYRELAAGGHYGTVIPERLFLYRVRPQSMLREIGAPHVERIADELRAHLLEASVRWTAPEAAALG
jgi:glycogen synthase